MTEENYASHSVYSGFHVNASFYFPSPLYSSRFCCLPGRAICNPSYDCLYVHVRRRQLTVARLVTTFDLLVSYMVLCHSKFRYRSCRPPRIVNLSGYGTCPFYCIVLLACHKNIRPSKKCFNLKLP